MDRGQNEAAAGIARSLRPQLLLSTALGITFAQGRSKPLAVLYRLTVLLLLSLCLVHEIPTIRFWVGKNRSLHGMLTAFETSLRWLVLLLNTVLNMLNNGRVVNFIHGVAATRLSVGGEVVRRMHRFQAALLLLNLSVLSTYMILGHNHVWSNDNHKWFTPFIYVLTEFYIAFGNFQFISFVYLLKQCCEGLNRRLEGLREGVAGRGLLHQIVDCRNLHLAVARQARRVNRCYSVQVLLFIVLALVEIIYSLRSFVSHVVSKVPQQSELWSRRPTLGFAHMLLWGGYYVSSLLQVVGSCDSSACESKKTSVIVHQLINEMKNPDVVRELELFSMQIMKNSSKFSACGFFDLDYALIHSITAAVTTYLVVFVSFRED